MSDDPADALTESTDDVSTSAQTESETDASSREVATTTHDGPKPVLWVSVTDHGRIDSDSAMDGIKEELERSLGDEYNVVVADDKVRLANEDDIAETLRELGQAARDAGLID